MRRESPEQSPGKDQQFSCGLWVAELKKVSWGFNFPQAVPRKCQERFRPICIPHRSLLTPLFFLFLSLHPLAIICRQKSYGKFKVPDNSKGRIKWKTGKVDCHINISKLSSEARHYHSATFSRKKTRRAMNLSFLPASAFPSRLLHIGSVDTR